MTAPTGPVASGRGVTVAGGFRAAGVTAGLKASGLPDLALVTNDGPLDVAAAVFTSNRVVGEPVKWSRRAVADGSARAVVLNSGGANVATGAAGAQDTADTAAAVAAALGDSVDEVLVASTGLIGVRLPISRLLKAIPELTSALADDEAAGAAAAQAIMTTDTVPKTAAAMVDGYAVGGMAKGAGMLAPALATMFAILTTDAVLDATTADTALRAATAATFDRLDSDGCMSTSDTVILLASGASGVSPDPARFAPTLREVC
ncbi:MAG: bifunctional ornithine acetyltransferase/N-acetylglutamate synthase, partial [Promicromonosporaceae bacterium]|nr:bifunctional ornithine acetyltransferase/N-acetylglutamate synthase [Promicromonosporaceae bacterium]